MKGSNMCLSVTTKDINYLCLPMKRHRLVDWIKNKTRTIYLLTPRNRYYFRMKGWKKGIKRPKNQLGITVIMSDIIEFK